MNEYMRTGGTGESIGGSDEKKIMMHRKNGMTSGRSLGWGLAASVFVFMAWLKRKKHTGCFVMLAFRVPAESSV